MITALVPTFNCEDTIRECLESIKWVDRIFIVDSFSTDSTLDICRDYTDWIVQHEYVNSATQKNWAMEQIEDEWVLQIDSDEYFDPELAREIQEKLANVDDHVDGFRQRRKNLIWGKWIASCKYYPDWQTRVFRAKKGRWTKREVHARVTGLDHLVDLEHHIMHYDITDLSGEIRQFANQVVTWEANELVKRGKRWSWIDVTLRPVAIFFLLYIRHGGFKDGFRGFYLSVYRAFYSFMTYTRLYEMNVQKQAAEKNTTS